MYKKKYILLKDDKITYLGRTLYRIKRLSDNLIGGYIENENNLSHEGQCFVYNNARVCENARISDSACVYDDAFVFGNALISDNALVYVNARVSGNALVYKNAKVFGHVKLREYDRINNKDQIINISGFKYNITVTPLYAHIGCLTFTPDQFYDKIVRDDMSEQEIEDVRRLILIAHETILSKLQGVLYGRQDN